MILSASVTIFALQLLSVNLSYLRYAQSFQVYTTPYLPTTTNISRLKRGYGRFYFGLAMAKGLNKQALLRQKMEEAKRQNSVAEAGVGSGKKPIQLSDEEIQERNDRLRFEQLLKQGLSSSLDSESPVSFEDDAEPVASEYRLDRLLNGDPVSSEPFEDLVSVKTGSAIGPKGKKQLLPWLRSSTNAAPYLVVLCDPRSKSPELRDTVKDLFGTLPPTIKNSMVVVNADTPPENRRWIKKNLVDDTLNVMSDEKLTWMRSFTALGEDRWSMTLFVLENGKIKRVVRDLDRYSARQAIIDAVKSEELRLG